jgi:hypothetical protein
MPTFTPVSVCRAPTMPNAYIRGMRFSLESELRSVLSGSWRNRDGDASKSHVFTEFRVGSVVPDVLALHWRGNYERAAELRDLTNLESHVLALVLTGDATSVDQIAARLYTRRGRIVGTLERLHRRGAVRQTGTGSYVLRRGAFPVGAEVTAVEAKLRRWRDAIAQAVAYTSFANRTYVALPKSSLDGRLDSIVETCLDAGLGLISVERNDLEFVSVAPKRRLQTPNWVWTIARAFSSRIPETHRQAAAAGSTG